MEYLAIQILAITGFQGFSFEQPEGPRPIAQPFRAQEKSAVGLGAEKGACEVVKMGNVADFDALLEQSSDDLSRNL